MKWRQVWRYLYLFFLLTFIYNSFENVINKKYMYIDSCWWVIIAQNYHESKLLIPLCFNKVILRILLGLRLIFGLLINCKISMISQIMTQLFRIPPGFISVCYFCFSYGFWLWLFKKNIFSMKSSQKRQFLAHEYC